MKKEEVYVEVRTEKQALKFKGVLDIFGEELFRNDTLDDVLLHTNKIGFDERWNWYSMRAVIGETKVSIKQLRNILASEHLKEGDVVVCGDNGSKSVGIFVEYEPEFGFELNDAKCIESGDSFFGGCFENFIRYATEQEKSLFDVKETPKSDGWYKYDGYPKFMVYLKNIGKCNESRFGFDIYGTWFDEVVDKEDSLYGYIKVSDKEVGNRLFAEAERRGLVKGVKIKSDWILGGVSVTSIENTSYSYSNNEVWTTGDCSYTLFKNGKWASVVEETPEQKVVKYAESVDWDFEKVVYTVGDTDDVIDYSEYKTINHGSSVESTIDYIFKKHNPHWELKKAFANGEEIQYLSKLSNGWITDPTPSWNPLYEYRIRPVKIGDWYSYKSGSIRKFTEVTESNLAHFQKREGKRITDKAVIEYLSSM